MEIISLAGIRGSEIISLCDKVCLSHFKSRLTNMTDKGLTQGGKNQAEEKMETNQSTLSHAKIEPCGWLYGTPGRGAAGVLVLDLVI
jgi:hypothetical protein